MIADINTSNAIVYKKWMRSSTVVNLPSIQLKVNMKSRLLAMLDNIYKLQRMCDFGPREALTEVYT